NLLGAEQHGFIASVGFEMFSQMLAEEIKLRKLQMNGEAVEEKKIIQTTIDLSVDAYLPNEYIYDSMQKIEIYKKAAAVSSIEESDELIGELLDRFGDLPQPVLNLMTVSRLKALGSSLGIVSISSRGEDFRLTFDQAPKKKAIRRDIDKLCMKLENRFKQAREEESSYYVDLRGKGLNMEQKLHLTEKFLFDYVDLQQKEEELHKTISS